MSRVDLKAGLPPKWATLQTGTRPAFTEFVERLPSYSD